MQKVKRYSRQIIVFFMALVTVATCLFIFIPTKADAGNTGYKYKLYFNIEDGGSTSASNVTVYFKNTNGTGGETSQVINSESGSWWTDDNGTKEFDLETTNYMFPTKVAVYLKIGTGRTVYYGLTISIWNYNTGSWVDVFTPTSYKQHGVSNSSGTFTDEVPASSFPAVNTANSSVSGASSVNIPTSGSTNTSFTASMVDQYGVDWQTAPSWSVSPTTGLSIASNGSLTTSSSAATGKTADYNATVTATAGGKSVSKSVTMRVPHTITVNPNGGSYSGTTPITGKYTGDVVSLGTPTKVAYNFSKWTASSGTVSGNSFTVPNGNATVSASWTPIGYTMSFDSNGGSSCSALNYNIESTSLSLPTPTRAGYTFTGWTISVPNGNWTSGSGVSASISGKYGNVTAKAGWTPKNYTINYDLNDASRIGSASIATTTKAVTYDSAVGTFEVPSFTGYTFDGWYTAASGGTEVSDSTVYTTADNSTVYAHWTPISYDATFAPAGGVAVSSISYDIENPFTFPADTRAGYTFVNWKATTVNGNWTADATFNAGASSPADNYGNVTFTAQWDANDYLISYDLNDADRVGTATGDTTAKTVTFDSAVGTLIVPSLTGYTFDGWFTAATGGTEVTASTIYKTADNSTVYAHWTPVTYTAAFVPAGGESVDSITYDIETPFTFPADTRTGYTFVNWKVTTAVDAWAADATYNAASASPDDKYGNVSFTAQWDDNDYTMAFDLNDASGIGSASCDTTDKTVTYDSAVGTLPVATRNGYTFDGWFTAATGGTEVTAETVYKTADNSTVYAHWTAIEYTITLNVNNGDAIAPITYTIEDDVTLPAATRVGYDFSYWINLSTTEGTWIKNTQHTADALALGTGNYGNVTLRANYNIKEFTITWDINGATTTEKYKYNTVPTHADPSYDDACYTYTFTSWSPAIEVATEDITYTAQFSRVAKEYTVTWEDENGSVLFTENVAYGATIPSKTVPSKTGYTGSWDSVPATMPAQDYTITATYAINSYTVTWSIDGDTSATSEFEYNSAVAYTGATPTKASSVSTVYTFAGWSATDGGAVLPTLPTMGAADVTYYAVFTPSVRQYTVKWDSNGTITTETYDYNETPSFKGTTPVKASTATTDYTFSTWSPSIAAVNADVTYTAQFSESARKYTATWVADGNVVFTEEVANGSSIPSKTVPVKTGYTGAWSTAYTVMPAQNITITAAYTPIKYTITWSIDGTDTTAQWDYDSTPVYSGTPVKTADAEYTYIFKEWSPAVSAVTGAATYTAVFDKTPNVYTLTWRADGVVVRTDSIAFGTIISNVPTVPEKTNYAAAWGTIPATMPAADTIIDAVYIYGARTISWDIEGAVHTTIVMDGNVPSYTGTPLKAATAEYSYTFAGWSATSGGTVLATLPTVNGANVTYYAIFTPVANSYTVKWMADGSEVASESIAYGSSVPSKTVPAKTGYTGVWDKTVTTMPAEDVTITAVYTPKKYTISWDVNGTVTQEQWDYDSMPSFSGSTDKASTATTDYAFAGWDTSISIVDGNKTYTATYTESARKYTVTWYDDDNTTVLYTEQVANGAVVPTKALPTRTGYTCEWTGVPSAMTTFDISITASYTPIKYTITWAMPSGNVTEQWDYDSTPVYSGATPTKTSTASTDYTFKAWDKTITKVTGNTTYTATFDESVREYTITWIVNGVSTTEQVGYGTVPAFTGSTDKASTATTDYTFNGWNNSVVAVSGDASYTATYVESARKYTVSWVANGSEVYSEQVANGSAIPAKDVPAKTGYTGVWNSVPSVMPTSDVTITAVYTPKNYTITWSTPQGDYDTIWAYDSTPSYTGSTPSKDATAEYNYTFSGWSPAIGTVTGDTTYTAQFAEHNQVYKITWVVDGSVLETRNVEYSAAIPAITVPEKTGSTGVWSTPFTTMPSHDITIQAVYVATMYTVYWKVDGLTKYAEAFAYMDVIPTDKVVPEKVGYIGTWETTYTTMPAENIVINAVYTLKVMNVQWNFTAFSGNATVNYGSLFTTTFSGGTLPANIRVMVDGVEISSELYTYDDSTGAFTLNASAVTGNITITERAAEGYHYVTETGTNGSGSNTATLVPDGVVYHTNITAGEGRLFPETVRVYIDGVLLTDGYTYSKNTGRLTVNAEAMKGDLTFEYDCPVDPNYVPPTPDQPDDPDEDDDSSNGGIFGGLYDFFMRIIKFFKKLFGVK